MKKLLLPILLVATTPWLLFITSTNTLFLGNQEEFGGDLRLYLPGAILFALSAAFGFGLVLLSRIHWLGTTALGAFAAIGPLFWLYGILDRSEWPQHQDAAVSIFLATSVISIGIGSAKFLRLHRWIKAYALIGGLLIVGDIAAFATKFDWQVGVSDVGNNLNEKRREDLPDVYHILVDSYQTGGFLETATQENIQSLRGFILYTKIFSVFRKTIFSTMSMFSGLDPSTVASMQDNVTAAYGDQRSYFFQIKQAGYQLICVNCRKTIYKTPVPNRPDVLVNVPRDNAQVNVVQPKDPVDDTFMRLWANAFLPKVIAQKYSHKLREPSADSDDITPPSAAPRAYRKFKDFIAYVSEQKGAGGRYFYFHIGLPHTPFVMRSDCTNNEGYALTSAREQVQCVNKLIGEFVAMLKAHDRFDEAIVLIHADHGLGIKEWTNHLTNIVGEADEVEKRDRLARHNSLVLLKVANAADAPLIYDDQLGTLLDLAPTVYQLVGIPRPKHLDGVDWLSREPRDAKLTMYDEKVDFRRYVVEDGSLEIKEKALNFIFNPKQKL